MENNDRPNPDELIESIKKKNESSSKGKLKIYLGMCAGVGKTFTMLQDAGKAKGKGTDTVIGYVETHGRAETEFLLFYLEQIERKEISYKNIKLYEMDLDAILARRPELVIVDELPHTNAPGSRHKKRFQDVLEILNNGIDVYTALNVQHLESRADFVAQITGIRVTETVPDSLLDLADEVELVDISPDELLQRLKDGKVYTKDKSKDAVRSFFRKGNLTALREMSLRLTAERVDKQLRDYMSENRIPGPWKSGQRILIAISSSPSSAHLIRWARKVSYTLKASLVAVNIETSKYLSEQEINILNKNIELVKELGAEFISTTDENIVNGILRIAGKENVTDIIVGKSKENKFKKLFSKNIVQKLIDESGDIDIYVVSGNNDNEEKQKIKLPLPQSSFLKYLISGLCISIASLVLYPLSDFIGYQSVALILLFIISLLPLYFGPGPVLLASFMSPLIWNYFFVPPYHTFRISKTEDALLFVLFFIITTITSILTLRIRRKEFLLRKREERATALYKLIKEFSESENKEQIISTFKNNIQKVFKYDSEVFLTNESEELLTEDSALSSKEKGILNWVFSNRLCAGKNTDTLPDSEYMFFPLNGTQSIYGVTAIKPLNKNLSDDEKNFLELFINLFTTSLEKQILSETANKINLMKESEKLYKNIFDSISHELKTPISAIIGAVTLILDKKNSLTEKNILDLIKETHIGANRLNMLVENLLDMTRLESGRLEPNLAFYDFNDVLNSAVEKLQNEIAGINLIKSIPDDMPLIYVDAGLMEQVMKNLLLNSVKYSGVSPEIKIKTKWDEKFIYIKVSDKGEGVPEEHLNHIFDKFYRVNNLKTGGSGLGLSIVKGFIQAHRGEISVRNNPDKGVTFEIRIPNIKYQTNEKP
jgi:two-component system sensor histidine kinase KdpD